MRSISGETLKEDLQRRLGGAAALEQFGGTMDVDVMPSRQRAGGVRRVPGSLERLLAPPLDALELRTILNFCRWHRVWGFRFNIRINAGAGFPNPPA